MAQQPKKTVTVKGYERVRRKPGGKSVLVTAVKSYRRSKPSK